MMMVFPASFIFFVSLVFSTILMLSASSWVMMWVGMELNTLMFVVIVVSGKSLQSLEAGVKYFLAQASGSVLFLLGAVSMSSGIEVISWFCFCMGVFFKAGMAPCHMWFPQVMGSLGWMSCFILSTWQKVGPVFIIFNIIGAVGGTFILGASLLSAWVGAMGAFKQSQLRSLMAYSSISHMGWMGSISVCSNAMASVYFVSYMINAGMIFVVMWYFSAGASNLSKSSFWKYPFYRLALMILLLSLSGMPPLFGFYPKVVALCGLMDMGMVFQGVGLAISSVVTLYVYLSVFVNGFFVNGAGECSSFNSASSGIVFVFSVCFGLGIGAIVVAGSVMYALNYIY